MTRASLVSPSPTWTRAPTRNRTLLGSPSRDKPDGLSKSVYDSNSTLEKSKLGGNLVTPSLPEQATSKSALDLSAGKTSILKLRQQKSLLNRD